MSDTEEDTETTDNYYINSSSKYKNKDETVVTKQQLMRAIPKDQRKNLTEEIVDTLNKSITDPNFREVYRENLLGFSHVIESGRYKLQSYIDAVKYVTYKFTGAKDIDAYVRTFPERYKRLKEEGASDKTVSSYASAYKKTQLVQRIFEQNMIPVHIFNADTFQKAVNTQAKLMMTAKSEKVRSDAANSLMSHLKPPELKRIEFDVGIKQDKTLDDLREATRALVKMQKEQLELRTVTPRDIAHSSIIKDEIEEIIENPEDLD
jgi:hypothetical protein